MANKFSISTIFDGVDKLSPRTAKMAKSVDRFSKSAIRSVQKFNQKTTKIFAGFGKGLAVGGAVVGGALLVLNRNLNTTAQKADDLAKTTRRLKFPIDEFQEWTFVSEQAGVGSELFNKSIEAFNKRLGEMKAGTGAMATLLKKTNPALMNQLKNTDNVSDALSIYIKAMRDLDDPTKRAALASAAFSRAGLKMANIADLSTDAIEKLRNEQRENGILTLKQAEAAEAYNDAVNSLKRSLVGIRDTALAPLLPIMTEYVTRIREFVINNKELINQKVKAFFDGMVKGVQFLIDNIDELVAAGKFILQVVGWFIALKVALAGITTVLTTLSMTFKAFSMIVAAFKVIPLIISGGLALMSKGFIALGAAILATPIGWLIGLIVGLVAVGVLLVKNWDTVKQWFSSFWDFIKEMFKKGVDFILSKIDFITNPLGKLIDGAKALGKLFNLGGDEDVEKKFTVTRNVQGDDPNDINDAGVVSRAENVASVEQQINVNNGKATKDSVTVRILDDSGRAVSEEENMTNSELDLVSSGGF